MRPIAITRSFELAAPAATAHHYGDDPDVPEFEREFEWSVYRNINGMIWWNPGDTRVLE